MDKTTKGVGINHINNFKGGDGQFESRWDLIGNQKSAGTKYKSIFKTISHLIFKNLFDNLGIDAGQLGLFGG